MRELQLMEWEGKPRDRQTAKEWDVKYYITGKACVNGHYAFRDTRTGQCVECLKQLARKKNKEARPFLRTQSALRNYGISAEQYEAMLKSQGGKCAICYKLFGDNRQNCSCIDHNHSTGEIRGLLCNRCNSGIGFFDDQIDLLSNAMRYLQKYSVRPIMLDSIKC